MKAAFIRETGPASNIQYGDLPKPTARGSEALVKVGAVSVNPIDTYVRSGNVAMNLPVPYIVGCDLAGTVEAVGPDARRFKPGDRVWGSCQGLMGRQGTFAEYAAVDEAWLYPTPSDVSDEVAAAGALVGLTASLGLFRDVKLKAGETLFVHGGTGGVGSAVLQLAKAASARVITTASTDAKSAAAREMGADMVINYKKQSVAAEVKKFAPEGVNVFWETLREPNFDEAVAMLAPRGRMVIMAGRDARPLFPVGPFYVKGLSLFGFAMFNATTDELRAAAERVSRWLAEGKFKPKIDRVLPLAETAQAHQLQEQNTLGKAGTLAGKIVLKP